MTMPDTTNKPKRKRARGPVCSCDAYRFPHREGGGRCDPEAAREAALCCGTCGGSGGGEGYWRCTSCGGTGQRRMPRYRDSDEYADDEYDRRGDR